MQTRRWLLLFHWALIQRLLSINLSLKPPQTTLLTKVLFQGCSPPIDASPHCERLHLLVTQWARIRSQVLTQTAPGVISCSTYLQSAPSLSLRRKKATCWNKCGVQPFIILMFGIKDFSLTARVNELKRNTAILDVLGHSFVFLQLKQAVNLAWSGRLRQRLHCNSILADLANRNLDVGWKERKKSVCLCVEAQGNQVRTNSHTDNYHQGAIVPRKKLELCRGPIESVSSFVSCVCRLASVCQEKPKEYKRKIMSVQGHANKVKHTCEPVTRRRVLFHFFSNKKVEINRFLNLSISYVHNFTLCWPRLI